MNPNPFVVNALQVTERKPTIRTAAPPAHTPGRMQAIAQHLTLQGHARARAELLSEALCAYAALCYESDTFPGLCNVDVDGRCLRPAPWGKVGAKLWGLRRTEADVLRAVLMAWSSPGQGDPLPLWTWDPITRGWYLNLQDYPTMDAATGFLKHRSITGKLVSRYTERVQMQRRQWPSTAQKARRR